MQQRVVTDGIAIHFTAYHGFQTPTLVVVKYQLMLLDTQPYGTASLYVHSGPRANPSQGCGSITPCLDLYARTIPIPPHSFLLPDASYEEDPAFSARAAFACARFLTSPCLPFCNAASISSRLPRIPFHPLYRRSNSPPIWRIADPCLHGARRRVSCRPSGFGARRGRRRRGSGCSCAVEEPLRQSPKSRRAIGRCSSKRSLHRYSPKACGFPRERHLV